jgi:glucose-6-phosphate dehydrogenase assembly protein OpcA
MHVATRFDYGYEFSEGFLKTHSKKETQAEFAWVFFTSWKNLSASSRPHPPGNSSKRALAM